MHHSSGFLIKFIYYYVNCQVLAFYVILYNKEQKKLK